MPRPKGESDDVQGNVSAMIVDIHAHYHPRAYHAALQAMPGWGGGRGFAGGRLPDTDDEEHLQARLAMMDEAGVGVQVLSPAAGWAPYSGDQARATEAARIGNDTTAQLVARWPERFKAFVSLPLPHVDACLSELTRSLDELGMVGVNIHCSVLDRSPADDAFLPLYEELNARSAVILFHPTGNGIRSPLVTEWGLNSAVGTSLEDTMVALHLIARRIPSRFPNITFVVPHLGGPIAMLLERLDNQFSMRQHDFPEPPSVTARRFYYDTVGHGSHAALWCASKAFGADHLLVGTDFPVLEAFESYARTVNWIRDAGLPEADLTQILGNNILQSLSS
jgi:predicted TIM-barrel fold metal-dependent hydrolase